MSACGPPPRLQRPFPGQALDVRLDRTTRPALLLRSGESLHGRARLSGDSRLLLAAGVLPGELDRGRVRVALLQDGVERAALELTPPLSRWRSRLVPLPGRGEALLEIRAEHHRARGRPPAEARSIAVAAPRLYSGTASADRVLLWLSQDALRADHLGAYGYPRPTSPRFDAFARGAALFEQAVATAPWTLPSLASQFTSRYPSFHGSVLHGLATDDASVFEALRDAGFTVLGVTGNDLVSAEHSLSRGFDVLVSQPGRVEKASGALLEALAEWGGGDLALYAHFINPHTPYQPSPEWRESFVDPRYDGPVTGGSNFPREFPAMSPDDRQHIVDLYDAEVAANDDGIGGLLDALSGRGLLSRAVVAYTADHGEEFLEHGSWLHGTSVYEETIRVPLALSAPSLPARRIKEPVSLVDLAPTLLALLSVSAPASFRGRSLLDGLESGGLARTPVFAETVLTAAGHVLAVRLGTEKAIFTLPREAEPEAPMLGEEFFDLARDAAERRRGLSAASEGRLRQIARAYLTRARHEGRRGRPVIVDPETLEKLKAWGYIQ